jgi:hypothetical protein
LIDNITGRGSQSFALNAPKFPPTHIIRISGVQGYIGYNSDQSSIILAFRGSSNVQNWLVDFAFPLVQFDGLPQGAKVFLVINMQHAIFSSCTF